MDTTEKIEPDWSGWHQMPRWKGKSGQIPADMGDPGMTEKIEPAMTPEEWENSCPQGECRADEIWALCRGWNPIPNDDDEDGTDSRVEPPFHRVAALCLRDQPFGFTQEDVAFLRANAFCDSAEDAGYVERMKGLAARIEALLPPEAS